MVIGVFGQPKSPVNWNYEVKKKTADTYDIVITASIDPHWHLYSQHTGKGGPIPTTIVTKTNPLVSKIGALKELGKAEKVFDKLFNTNVVFFSDQVQYVQTVKVKNGVKTNISGTVEYMVCDDSQCLPPVKKSFDLKLQ
jgi:thiol:disulfide interchange protein DsbD